MSTCAPSSPAVETGVIHGRFQPLHRDHLAYLVSGFAACNRLVIGITNPDPVHTRHSAADPARSSVEANPYSYYHRAGMIEAALDEAGVSRERYRIVPFPVQEPDLWGHYLPLDATFLLSIYDAWGEEKRRSFEQAGLATRVIRRCQPGEKGLSATEVRRRMRTGGKWQQLLPKAVAAYLEREGLVLQPDDSGS